MTSRLRGSAVATTFQLDASGCVASWPETAQELFGHLPSQILGQRLSALIDTSQRDACGNVVQHVCCTVRPGAVHTMELIALRADASIFHAECSLWPCQGSAAPGASTRFDVLVRNVSERVRFEQDQRQELRELRQFSVDRIQEARRSQARFMDIAETIDEVFWIADAAVTRMLYISPGYERVWGRSCQSLYDNPRSFIDAMHPEDRERVGRDLLAGRDGQSFDHEYRIVRPDGVVLWIWDRGYPVRGQDGVLDRYIGVAQDITARKATEASLRRQETIDAIGHMTGGLAHDFNNVLGLVVGHLDLIGLALPQESALRESVDLALDAAMRGARLARRLLALARREPVERRLLGLSDAVQELRPLLQYAAGDETSVVVRAAGNPIVSVDPGELDAALINLAVNARAAMPGGGCLTIEIEALELTTNASSLGLSPGRYASLIVDDTGCGMSDEVLSRLGEPFFTTRSDGDGTGLGVPMIHAFARQSGGVLRVESRPGEGSRFRILLPVATDAVASERQHRSEPTLQTEDEARSMP